MKVEPPLKYDQLKGSTVNDKSWRKVYDDEGRWKKRLSEALDALPEAISAHSHAVIEGCVERILKDRG